MIRGTARIYEAVGAINTNGSWAPASWISPDGFNWSAPSLSFPIAATARPDPGGATVDSVSATSTGLVAVGGGDGIAMAWTSTDGRSWTPLSLPTLATTAAWHSGLVASDGTTTAIADPDAGTPRLLVGRGSLVSPATATAPTASSPTGLSPSLGWSEPTSSAPVWGTPRAEAKPVELLSAGGTLLLIVDVAQPGQVLGQDQLSVVVLTSTDGSAWNVVPTGTAFAGGRVAAALAAPSSTIGALSHVVAVGAQAAPIALLASPQTEAAAWLYSPDPAKAGTAGAGGSWTTARATGEGFGTGATATAADAVTRLADGSYVAVGTGPGVGTSGPGGQPIAWTSADGTAWTLTGALDRPTALLDQTPNGACTGPSGAVAVGAGAVGGPGSKAVAWTSPNGASWTKATVPAPVNGGVDTMTGCASLRSPGPSASRGMVAWGSATAADGTHQPALWRSPTAATWTRQKVAAFDEVPGISLSDVAIAGSSWLAAGGRSTATTDTGAGGGLGLWQSTDAGATWARVDTGTMPWQASSSASLDQVAWLGGTGVAAGTINGQLAVWISPASAG